MIYEDGVCVLEIAEIGADSEGIYTCTATNEVGQARTACLLHITEEKILTQEEQSAQSEFMLSKEPDEDRLDAVISTLEVETAQQLVLPSGSEMAMADVELKAMSESEAIQAILLTFDEVRESSGITVRLDFQKKTEDDQIAQGETDLSETAVPTADLPAESPDTPIVDRVRQLFDDKKSIYT